MTHSLEVRQFTGRTVRGSSPDVDAVQGSSTPIRLLMVDDHRMFADALMFLLSKDEGIEVVGIARSAEQAIDRWKQTRFDVVIVHADPPGTDAIEATRALTLALPDVRVVVITASQEPEFIATAIEAGASAYVPRSYGGEDLIRAIRQAACGEITVPVQELIPTLIELRRRDADRSRRRGGIDSLTGRENQILWEMANARTTGELAKMFGISSLTVRTHIRSILFKLEAHSRLEAVTEAIRAGFIQVPPKANSG